MQETHLRCKISYYMVNNKIVGIRFLTNAYYF
jgi:hypothetical protein